jgi:hypothetical protein
VDRMHIDSCEEYNVVFCEEMRPQVCKEGPVAGSDLESKISVAGGARAEGSSAVRPLLRGPAAVFLSGLADDGEFDDSLAAWRGHRVMARCNHDFGLDDGWCQLGERCVELLAIRALPSERGSEMARGLLTAVYDSAREPVMGGGRCVARTTSGAFCRERISERGRGAGELRLCGLHVGEHAVERPVARRESARFMGGGAEVLPLDYRQLEGNCGICVQPLR